MLCSLLLAPLRSIWYLWLLWARLWLHFAACAAVRGVLFQAYLLGIFLGIYERLWREYSVHSTAPSATAPASDALRWWTNRLYASHKRPFPSRCASRGPGRSLAYSSAHARQSNLQLSPLEYLQAGLDHVRRCMGEYHQQRRVRDHKSTRRSSVLSHGSSGQRSPSSYSNVLPWSPSLHCSSPPSPTRSLVRPGPWSPIALRSTLCADEGGQTSTLGTANGEGAVDATSPCPSPAATIAQPNRWSHSCKRSSSTLLSSVGFDSDEDAPIIHAVSCSNVGDIEQLLPSRLSCPLNAATEICQPCSRSKSLSRCAPVPPCTGSTDKNTEPRRELHFSGNMAEPLLQSVSKPFDDSRMTMSAENTEEASGFTVDRLIPYTHGEMDNPEAPDITLGLGPSVTRVTEVPAIYTLWDHDPPQASPAPAAAIPTSISESVHDASYMGPIAPRERDQDEPEWGSATPSWDFSNLPLNGKNAGMAADADWSFDTPPWQAGGEGNSLSLDVVPSSLATAAWPRGNRRKAAGSPGQDLATAGMKSRENVSPLTPKNVSPLSPNAKPPPGSAGSCYTLALSPDFSPTLPLPSTTLFSRNNPGTSVSSGNHARLAFIIPHCALLQTPQTDLDEHEASEDYATPSVIAATAPKRRLLMDTPENEGMSTQQEDGLRTPMSTRSPSGRSARSELPKVPPRVRIRSMSYGSASGKLGGTAKRTGAAMTVAFASTGSPITPGSTSASVAIHGARSTPSVMSGPRRSTKSSSDAISTGSATNPRYLRSTVSWNLKHG